MAYLDKDKERAWRREYKRKERKENPELARKRDADRYAKDIEKSRAANRQKTRKHRLKVKYNITLDQFNELFTSQGNVCASCGAAEAGSKYGEWHVDHCHNSNKVRGILCHHCNTALGLLKDNPKTIRALASYVERFGDD